MRIKTDCDDLYQLSRCLFFAFAKENRALLELMPKKASLEEVFLELTETDSAESAQEACAEQGTEKEVAAP